MPAKPLVPWTYAGCTLLAATKAQAIRLFRERFGLAVLPRGACVKKARNIT